MVKYMDIETESSAGKEKEGGRIRRPPVSVGAEVLGGQPAPMAFHGGLAT